MLNRMKRNWATAAIFLCFFIVLFRAPLQSDDYEFAALELNGFADILRYALYYGNGRFLGNVLSVLLSKSPILAALVKASVVTSLIMVMPAVVRVDQPRESEGLHMIFLGFVFLFGMYAVMFAQVFNWTSGFSNYSPSALLFLLCLLWTQRWDRADWWRYVLIGLVGFCGQLFVEHSTILAVLLAALLWLRYEKREKNTVKRNYAGVWLFSGLLGAAVMVLIPKLFYYCENRVDGYREIHLDSILSLVKSVVLNGVEGVSRLSAFWIFWCLLSIMCLLLSKACSKAKIGSCRLVQLILYVYPVISLIFRVTDQPHNRGIYWLCKLVFAYLGLMVYLCAVIYTLWKLDDKQVRNKILGYFALSVVPLVPFLLVSPFGERCMFLTYVFMIMAVLTGWDYLISSGAFRPGKRCTILCVAVAVVMVLNVGLHMHQVKQLAEQRHGYIRSCMETGADEIFIFNIPTDYLTVYDEVLMNQYFYYEEKGDIWFEVMRFEEWNALYGPLPAK